MFYLITDVGPLIHASTSGISTALILNQLQQFEIAVNNLRANGGHDHPEYALDAMLVALQYSFTDEYGGLFTPMGQNSKMVVITDATSKNPSLERTVIDTARRQGVASSIESPLPQIVHTRCLPNNNAHPLPPSSCCPK